MLLLYTFAGLVALLTLGICWYASGHYGELPNLKDALGPVPQPYKTWVAHAILPPFFLIGLLPAAVIGSAGWIKYMYYEIIDAWHDARTW